MTRFESDGRWPLPDEEQEMELSFFGFEEELPHPVDNTPDDVLDIQF